MVLVGRHVDLQQNHREQTTRRIEHLQARTVFSKGTFWTAIRYIKSCEVPYTLDAEVQDVKDACRHRGMQHGDDLVAPDLYY